MLKKYKNIIITTFIALIFFTIFMLFNNQQSPPSEYADLDQNISVINTTPQNNSTNALISTDIGINFSSNFTFEHQKLISYSINPDIETSSHWIQNNKLILTPSQFLTEDNFYTVKITFNKKKIHEFTFQTKNTEDLSLDEQVEILKQGEVNYNESLKEDFEKNPWKFSLPLITENYTVVYSPANDAYSIDFLKNFTSEDKLTYESEIKTILDSLNAPTKKFIYFD